MELMQQVKEALAQPPGTNAALLGPVLTGYFAGQLGREVQGGGRRYDLDAPADLDALFRHLAGGTWAAELVRLKQEATYDTLLALGFRDAPFSDVVAFAARNQRPLAQMLDARAGVDSPEVLLDFANRATARPTRPAAFAAAIAAMPSVPAGLEAELDLNETGWPPLLRRALRALGPARASEVALRQLRSADGSQDAEHLALFKWQALVPVQECFGPFFTPQAEQVIAERTEELGAADGYKYWEGAGERLASTGEWEAVTRFAEGRAAKAAGWRRALRIIVDARVARGWALPPEADALIDVGGAAKLDFEVWRVVQRLLASIPVERAERLLAEAKFDQPTDPLRFLIPGLSAAALLRLAELHVSLREDPSAKDTLAVTDLRPLGPGFGAALQAALAAVKPKVSYLKALERNLDAPVCQALSQWLEERPAPKKAKPPPKSKQPKQV